MSPRFAPRSLLRASTQFTAPARPWSRSFVSTPRLQKTAIVTGSARGMLVKVPASTLIPCSLFDSGKAIAIRLAEDGYDVTVNDIAHNKAQAEEVVSHIRSLGRKSALVIGDVSKRADVRNIVKTSVQELGPLDTMVANAGIAQVKPLLKLTDEDFRRMFEVNVYGVFHCYTEAAKQMIEQGGGGKLIGCARYVSSLLGMPAC